VKEIHVPAFRPLRVAVIGATGQTGPHVVQGLVEAGHEVTAIARDAARLAACDARARHVAADIADRAALAGAVAGIEAVVCLAPHRLFEDELAALPPGCRRVVAAGSIRKYSRFDDALARSARSLDEIFRRSGRDGVVLNFSMVYGQPEDRMVNRIIATIRRFGVVPLPDGGRHLVQPLFIDDMVAAVRAALERDEAPGDSIDVAGPRPIAYRDMVEACAAALGRKVVILSLPSAPFVAWLRAAALVPSPVAEFARMAEDKRVDVAAMRRRLGVDPAEFEEGLRRKLERGWLVTG